MTILPLALTVALGASPIAAASDVAPVQVGVPFGCGRSFPISQSHNTGSHLHNDTWAWDFRMPEGTPIVSASDGVVRLARGDQTVGGCDAAYAKFANYVVVDHGDGLETQYLHFSKVVVKPGQKVKAGELIGYSGKTGWSCGPHLHFKVAQYKQPGWNNPSVPAQLVGYGDPAVETLIAAPACKSPEVQLADSNGGAGQTVPAAASAQDEVIAATSTPELAAAGVQPTATPNSDLPAPVGDAEAATGASATSGRRAPPRR